MKSNYVCTTCEETYLIPSNIIQEIECPRVGCDGTAFYCDEQMTPVILELNKKGYKTKFCCSDHISDYIRNSQTFTGYIVFDKIYKFDKIPEGWYLSYRRDHDLITNEYRYTQCLRMIECDNLLLDYHSMIQLNINNRMNELFKWTVFDIPYIAIEICNKDMTSYIEEQYAKQPFGTKRVKLLYYDKKGDCYMTAVTECDESR